MTSLVAQTVKNLLARCETWVPSLGWEDPLEKGMATHSSILAWRIPQRSLVGYSPWGRKTSDTSELLTHTNSLYLLLPSSKIIPPPHFSLLVTMNVFSVSGALLLFHR